MFARRYTFNPWSLPCFHMISGSDVDNKAKTNKVMLADRRDDKKYTASMQCVCVCARSRITAFLTVKSVYKE